MADTKLNILSSVHFASPAGSDGMVLTVQADGSVEWEAIPAQTDANAIHVSTGGEIAGIAAKTTPVTGDLFVIEDSAASNAKKRLTYGNLLTTIQGALTITESQISDLDHNDTTAYHSDVAGEIAATTLKGSPTGSDLLLIEDAAAGNAKKRIAISTLPSGATDHGALTGLTDDDHSIYVLLAGRSSGQTIVGGTGASENLLLTSTSHGTKGVVGTTGLVFEVNADATATDEDPALYLSGGTGAAVWRTIFTQDSSLGRTNIACTSGGSVASVDLHLGDITSSSVFTSSFTLHASNGTNRNVIFGLNSAATFSVTASSNVTTGLKMLLASSASAGDVTLIWDGDVTDWYAGLDDSDSDTFKMGTGSSMGSNVMMRMTSGGVWSWTGHATENEGERKTTAAATVTAATTADIWTFTVPTDTRVWVFVKAVSATAANEVSHHLFMHSFIDVSGTLSEVSATPSNIAEQKGGASTASIDIDTDGANAIRVRGIASDDDTRFLATITWQVDE